MALRRRLGLDDEPTPDRAERLQARITQVRERVDRSIRGSAALGQDDAEDET